MSSYVKNDLSKFFSIGQLETTVVIFDFNPSNGSLNDARELSFPSLTFTSMELHASGAISDNKLLCSTKTATSEYYIVSIINTDTWTVSSYQSQPNIINFLLGFSELFSQDQIVLSISKQTSGYFTIRTAYDKLNMTELFTS